MQKLLLVGGLMTLLGCSDAASPRDLAISIELTSYKSPIRLGDTLSIAVTVLNMGERAYTLTSDDCPGPFRVYGPDGDRVPVGTLCGGTGLARRLERGDSHTFQFTWVAPKATTAQGSYWLRGFVREAELGDIEAGLVRIYISP